MLRTAANISQVVCGVSWALRELSPIPVPAVAVHAGDLVLLRATHIHHVALAGMEVIETGAVASGVVASAPLVAHVIIPRRWDAENSRGLNRLCPTRRHRDDGTGLEERV